MVKKRTIIEETFCDFCGRKAQYKCQLCGRDICSECARFICKKTEHSISGGTWVGAQPVEYSEEATICKDCAEKFKMSLATLAGS